MRLICSFFLLPQENGDLMYTYESIDDDDEEFLEPVTIVPNTKEFDCHVDSATGHVHVFSANGESLPR